MATSAKKVASKGANAGAAAPASAKKGAAPPTTDANASGAHTNDDATSQAHANQREGASADSGRRKVALEDPFVTVTVPKRFNLQASPGIITPYEPGVQEMLKSHADHVYAKANGVVEYVPPSKSK